MHSVALLVHQNSLVDQVNGGVNCLQRPGQRELAYVGGSPPQHEQLTTVGFNLDIGASQIFTNVFDVVATLPNDQANGSIGNENVLVEFVRIGAQQHGWLDNHFANHGVAMLVGIGILWGNHRLYWRWLWWHERLWVDGRLKHCTKVVILLGVWFVHVVVSRLHSHWIDLTRPHARVHHLQR